MIISSLARSYTVAVVAALLTVSSVSAEQSIDDTKLALAERLVELQDLDAFFQAEWEFQMQQMDDAMKEHPQAEWSMPEGYMEAMREQQVNGQVNDWVEAWASAFDEERLRQLITYLERPESQAWVADRLEAYPHFLDALSVRAEAMVDVFTEEQFEGVEEEAPSLPTLDEISPVVDSALAEVLEFVPGARIEAALDNEWFENVRVPARDPAISQVFADLEVRLSPDGRNAARVVQVSSERAYASEEACEAARAGLEESLIGHFPDSEETDCGTVRYLAAGGDIRMSLGCRNQESVGASRLRLSIVHEPTRDSAHERFMAQAENWESDSREDGGETEADVD